jgi:RNA polymerase sigma-70 factor (ECF subfamily)
MPGIINTQQELVKELSHDKGQKSRDAFCKLYTTYSPVLYGFISRQVSDVRMAEDILQKTFITIWSNKHAIGKQPLLAWLIGMTKKTMTALAAGVTAENQNGALHVYIDNRNNIAINNEPPTAILDDLYYNGLSLEEVAAKWNVEKNKLQVILRKAVSKIKLESND